MRRAVAFAALLLAPVAAARAEAPAPIAIRYLALGDSFTIGTGSPQSASFPSRLAARLTARGRTVTVENPARNGYSSRDVIDEELVVALAFRPDLVTLAVGANDIVQGGTIAEYRAAIRHIVAVLVESGVPPARIFALPQPRWSQSPVAATFGDRRALDRRIDELNAILREEVTARGGTYVDLSSLMARQARAKMVAPDGLHPSAAAYAEWAAELDRVIP